MIHTLSPAARACIIGVVLLGIAAVNAPARTLDFAESAPAGQIDSIEVKDQRSNWGIIIRNDIDTDIVLTEGRGSQVDVTLTGDVRSNRRRCLPELQVSRRGGRLVAEIVTCSGPTAFLSMSGRMTLEVSVPSEWRGDYSVEASSARVTIDGADLATVTLDVSSGSVEARGIDAERLTVESSSGSVRLEEIAASETAISSSSGAITVEGVTGDVEVETSSGGARLDFRGRRGFLTADSSSGRVEVEGIDGGVEIESSSGGISVAYVRLREDSRISASSGDITVRLPADSDLNVDLETSTGRINVDFPVTVSGSMDRDEIKGSIGDGGPTLTADASSGDIRIRQR
jgi:hypothetical protein